MTPFVILLLLIVLFHSAVAQQNSTACDVQCSYEEDLQETNCDSRQFESIPIECSQSTYLSLRFNQIAEIEPGIFRDFLHLERLILSHNNIYQINANTFNGAYQLEVIDLTYNHIHTFNRDALNGTENLLSIDLGKNNLSSIEEGTFQLALNLKIIDLSSNHLTYLSPAVFQDLKSIKNIFLNNNKLVDLPEDIFKDQSSLIYLDLANNLLSSLPRDIFKNLVQINILDLDANRLMAITFTLPTILSLKLRDNELKHLGNASIENWTGRVGNLYLEGNPWACNCSFEPFRSFRFRVSPYCDIRDNPVCASPLVLVNQSLKNVNQTCPLQNISSTTEVTNVGGRNGQISEHSRYSFFALVLPLGIVFYYLW
eukprot:XP_011662447.1 PREDICTED: leucine-rich repeat-containing protein 15-like [Strongylocentrotus purpuratus]